MAIREKEPEETTQKFANQRVHIAGGCHVLFGLVSPLCIAIRLIPRKLSLFPHENRLVLVV